MKLRRLNVNRLPGIDKPFEIDVGGDGLNIIYGPNGIGKSSICRAVEALLWNDRGPTSTISVAAEFEIDDDRWWVEREGGQTRWQKNGSDSTPPNLPPSYLHRSFFLRLRDLIESSPDGASEVAAEIRKQMSGGFNLPEVSSGRFEKSSRSRGRKIRKEIDQVSKAVMAEEGRQIKLHRQLEKIGELEKQLQVANQNSRRLNFIDRALGLVDRENKQNELVHVLSSFPESLVNLIGNELVEIEKNQDKLQAFKDRLTKLENELEVVKQNELESGLKEPIDPISLQAWRTQGTELQGLEGQLIGLKNDLNGFNKKLKAAIKAVGNGEIDDVEFDLSDHGELFEFLRSAHESKSKIDAIHDRIHLLKQIDTHDEGKHRSSEIGAAVDVLRSWLRAPGPELAAKRANPRAILLVIAGVLVIAGAALGFLIDPTLAAISGAGAGMILTALILRGRRQGSGERNVAKGEFEKLSLTSPEEWEPSQVESRLRELEDEKAELDARKVRAGYRDADIQGLKASLARLEDAETEIDAKRVKIRDELRLEDVRQDAELVDLARSLDQLRQGRADRQTSVGKVKECKIQYEAVLKGLNDALETNGEPGAKDAATALAGIDHLTSRNSKFQNALSDKIRLGEEIENVSTEVEGIGELIASIYSKAEMQHDDQVGLANLIESRPRYLKLSTEINGLRSKNELDREELKNAGEEGLTSLDHEELENLQRELKSSVETAEELRDEIASVNAEVGVAKSGHALEDLIEDRDTKITELQDQLNNELFDKAGQWLIKTIDHVHEEKQMPQVLERARNLFANFTHSSYQVKIDPAAEPVQLIAIDQRTSRGHSLDELSDGTRGQLLLAARIAFAEEAEQGATLPLFLDEALDQSDPARYHAIVKSLGRTANDQERQIFYFTSDPLDVQRIQSALAEEECDEAQSIDLGLVRGEAESVVSTSALQVDPRTSIPVPGDQSVEEYGLAIGTTPFDPRREHTDQHLFLLLWDDLGGLYELLEAGIRWVGQWRNVSGSDYGAKLKGRSTILPELDSRIELLQTFCELWKQGRGVPVDRDALDKSGALGDRWLDQVVGIATENNGSGDRLIEIIHARSDERLKGFRQKSVENLERYLRDNDYIDERAILNEDELLSFVLASPAVGALPDGVASECVRRWWGLAG